MKMFFCIINESITKKDKHTYQNENISYKKHTVKIQNLFDTYKFFMILSSIDTNNILNSFFLILLLILIIKFIILLS